MYAFVSNEYKAIVYSTRQLDFLLSVYSYPQFKKVETVSEAKKYFNQCNREFINAGRSKYDRESNIGYITIEYFIDNNNIFLNIYTKHFGFIKLYNLPSNIKQDSSYDLLKIKICDIVLDDTLIAHHCVAIMNALRLLDSSISIEFILPDISVYLACTKYKGNNYIIKKVQDELKSRHGNVFFTIK